MLSPVRLGGQPRLEPWVEGAWLEKRGKFKDAPGCSGGLVDVVSLA